MSVLLEKKIISFGDSNGISLPPDIIRHRKKITIIVLSIEEEKKIKRNKIEVIKNILGDNNDL
jgi:hypothetical protein